MLSAALANYVPSVLRGVAPRSTIVEWLGAVCKPAQNV